MLRLRRKVLELQRLLLNSKPGTKKNPSHRGNFTTCGCYIKILFAAETLHQLVMFLHFPDKGEAWASPYNSGTKSMEHIISELQEKTTELQSLDSQRRHWASKFFPGKEPLNPGRDIVLFGDVAIKKVSDGNSFYLIACIECIESTKDGTGVLSFKLYEHVEQQNELEEGFY